MQLRTNRDTQQDVQHVIQLQTTLTYEQPLYLKESLVGSELSRTWEDERFGVDEDLKTSKAPQIQIRSSHQTVGKKRKYNREMYKINTQDVMYSRLQKGVYLILKTRGIVKSILMLKSQVNNETNDWNGQTQRVLYDYKEFHDGGSVHICSSNMLSLRMHHKARAALPSGQIP